MSGTISYKTGLYQRLQGDTYVYYYLRAALEDSRPVFRLALQDVMEARNLSGIANEGELDRILSEAGNPTSETLEKILHALNLRLTIEVGVPPKPSSPDETDPQEESGVEALHPASSKARHAPAQR
jgi:DNA-binding phage protein